MFLFSSCMSIFSCDDPLESVCCYYFGDGMDSESLSVKEIFNMIILQ